MSLLAQDDNPDHALRATLGYDTALESLLGFYGYARYDYGLRVPLRATPRPLRFLVQAGSWPLSPHLSEGQDTGVGIKGSVTARLPQDRQVLSFGFETSLVDLLGQPSGVLFDTRVEAAFSANRLTLGNIARRAGVLPYPGY